MSIFSVRYSHTDHMAPSEIVKGLYDGSIQLSRIRRPIKSLSPDA